MGKKKVEAWHSKLEVNGLYEGYKETFMPCLETLACVITEITAFKQTDDLIGPESDPFQS